MLFGERDIQAVVCGRCLQLEIEAAAEALAQRQSPGFVDPRSKRCVDNQLHASTFIEEAFGNDGALRGNITENGAAFKDVLNGLGRA